MHFKIVADRVVNLEAIEVRVKHPADAAKKVSKLEKLKDHIDSVMQPLQSQSKIYHDQMTELDDVNHTLHEQLTDMQLEINSRKAAVRDQPSALQAPHHNISLPQSSLAGQYVSDACGPPEVP